MTRPFPSFSYQYLGFASTTCAAGRLSNRIPNDRLPLGTGGAALEADEAVTTTKMNVLNQHEKGRKAKACINIPRKSYIGVFFFFVALGAGFLRKKQQGALGSLD